MILKDGQILNTMFLNGQEAIRAYYGGKKVFHKLEKATLQCSGYGVGKPVILTDETAGEILFTGNYSSEIYVNIPYGHTCTIDRQNSTWTDGGLSADIFNRFEPITFTAGMPQRVIDINYTALFASHSDMIADNAPPPYLVYASSRANSNYATFKGFSGNFTENWISGDPTYNTSTGAGNEWIEIQNVDKICSRLVIKSNTTAGRPNTIIRDFKILASNSTTYMELKSVVNQDQNEGFFIIDFENEIQYNKYRIQVTRNYSDRQIFIGYIKFLNT